MAEPAAPAAPARKHRRRAEQRRQDLLQAALVTFAENGYHGARTSDIARRAGVSQPYVYALFPDKRALFLACDEWTTSRIRDELESARAQAAEGGEDIVALLGQRWAALVKAHPHLILFQIQAFAAASADPEIQGPVRDQFIELIELSERVYDAPRQRVLHYIAAALLFNMAVALDVPEDYRPLL
jgi:AcrR family transcriptional regulator